MEIRVQRRPGTLLPSMGRYYLVIVQGNQLFRLDYDGTRKDCEWYASMFRKALAFHDAEQT